MYELISACHREILQYLKAKCSSNISPKEPKISPIAYISQALVVFVVNSCPGWCFLCAKAFVKEEKCKRSVSKDWPIACRGKTVFLIPIIGSWSLHVSPSILFPNHLPVTDHTRGWIKTLLGRHLHSEVQISIGPFAGSGHMVRNKLCWETTYTVRLSKLRKVGLDWYEFPCFLSPTSLFASQHNLCRIMWPDRVEGLPSPHYHQIDLSWLVSNSSPPWYENSKIGFVRSAFAHIEASLNKVASVTFSCCTEIEKL